MDKKIKIVAFTGSLRKNSYNMSALRAAAELIPAGVSFQILDLSEIPFFNEDLEGKAPPAPVADFLGKIKEADALLISTPEYNYSISPVLKNALDWSSRAETMPLSGKPLGIMSASPGMLGGARVQYHLRQVCVCLNLHVLNRPEVFISAAHTKFDASGKLTDEKTKGIISGLLEALAETAKNNLK